MPKKNYKNGNGNGNGFMSNYGNGNGLIGADLSGADDALGMGDLSIPSHAKMADSVTDEAIGNEPDGSEVFDGHEGLLRGQRRKAPRKHGHSHGLGMSNRFERSKNTGRILPSPSRRKPAKLGRDKKGRFL